MRMEAIDFISCKITLMIVWCWMVWSNELDWIEMECWKVISEHARLPTHHPYMFWSVVSIFNGNQTLDNTTLSDNESFSISYYQFSLSLGRSLVQVEFCIYMNVA